MDELERFANWLSDKDAEWWPFLFMRPAHEERMGSLRVLGLAILYGFFAGAFTDAWIALAGHGDRVSFYSFPLGLTAGFFVVFRLTFAVAWNRRAARIARECEPVLERLDG